MADITSVVGSGTEDPAMMVMLSESGPLPKSRCRSRASRPTRRAWRCPTWRCSRGVPETYPKGSEKPFEIADLYVIAGATRGDQ